MPPGVRPPRPPMSRRYRAALLQAQETLDRERFVVEVMALTGWDAVRASVLDRRIMRLAIRRGRSMASYRDDWAMRTMNGWGSPNARANSRWRKLKDQGLM